MGDFRNEPEPHVDRFADNTSGPRAAHMMTELGGFPPTSVGSESDSGGWLRTTAPEGVPLTGLTQLTTIGMRGAENVGADGAKRFMVDNLASGDGGGGGD